MSPAAAPPTPPKAARVPSPITERATAFVAQRRERAETLGRGLAEHLHDPGAFVEAVDDALRQLADPEYLEGSHGVVPTLGPTYGVRWPLLAAILRGFKAETRRERPSTLLDLAAALLGEPMVEAHWIAFGLLDRTVPAEPERSWQQLRRAAAQAADWATVDALAHPFGRGILAEPYRWAELEQLVFSPSRWERRLVGSTIATIPHVERGPGREPIVVERGLALLGQLIGDAEPDVRKALSWAYRTLAQIDLPATVEQLRREAAQAAATDDGHRAWVIRDSLSKLPAPVGEELKHRLGSIRSRRDQPSTSVAAATAAGFLGAGLESLETPPADRSIIART
jgi:3-methyladenine DNA glycosylase AlkD